MFGAPTPGRGVVIIVAHRGASAHAPENTPRAVSRALADGADAIETDLRLTRDGVPVCCHDATLERLFGLPVAIADIDAAELPPGLATLEAMLEAVGTARLVIDPKITDPILYERALPLLAGRNLVMGARSLAQLRALRGKGPTLGLLPPDALGDFIAAGGTIFRLWQADATAERLAACPVPVWVTTDEGGVGEVTRDGLRALAKRRVAGVMVNDPAAARGMLEKKRAR